MSIPDASCEQADTICLAYRSACSIPQRSAV